MLAKSVEMPVVEGQPGDTARQEQDPEAWTVTSGAAALGPTLTLVDYAPGQRTQDSVSQSGTELPATRWFDVLATSLLERERHYGDKRGGKRLPRI